MKRHVLITSVFVLMTALGAFYFGCARPPSNENANLAIASPESTPDNMAIESELRRIENDFPRVLKEHDGAAVGRVEADDIILIYPDGSEGSKQRDRQDIESGALTADAWEVSDVVVKVLNNDAAVVTLRTNVRGGRYKAPDGTIQNVSGQFRSIDTFARRNSHWLLVASATVPIANQTPASASSSTPKAASTKASPAAKGSPE